LVDADMHVSVKGCIEETGEAVDDCILGDLKLDTGVSTIVNRFIRIRVDKSEDLFRFTELVDVVHLHHIPDARSTSAGAHAHTHRSTHAPMHPRTHAHTHTRKRAHGGGNQFRRKARHGVGSVAAARDREHARGLKVRQIAVSLDLVV
jgi:hypothetical protein